MSLTIGGILLSVFGPMLVSYGVSDTCTSEIAAAMPLIAGAVVAWIGRVRAGGITWYGAHIEPKP